MQRDEEDAVDNGWYDEDNEEKFAQERKIDESSLGGAELWSWKTAKLQDAVRFVHTTRTHARTHTMKLTNVNDGLREEGVEFLDLDRRDLGGSALGESGLQLVQLAV